MLLNVSPELLQVVGAKDDSEFAAKLVGLLKIAADAKSDTDALITLEGRVKKAQADIEALASLTPAASTLTEARVTELVTIKFKDIVAEAGKAGATEGSRVAAEALGATGTNPLRPSAPAEAPSSTSKQLEAAGKFEEQWAADEKLHAEFPTAGSYAGYMRALKGGNVAANLRN